MPQTEIIAPADYRQLYEGLLAKSAEQETMVASLRKENHRLRLSGLPLPNSGFEWLSNLQYKVRNLAAQVRDFKSGERYAKLQADHNAQVAALVRENNKLRRELAEAHGETISVRNIWDQIVDDLTKEHSGELAQKDRKIEVLEKELLEAQIELAGEKGRFREKCKELYKALAELEEEKGKNLKLTAQINRDYENSSKPSSMKPNHKKIENNRDKTGKKPGGQPGHEGHPRKKHIPACVVDIPTPEEYLDISRYKPTGRIITKQLVDISVTVVVTEYSTPEYRDLRTRCRVHADFPEGMVNEVTYSGNVKALAFLLNNRCNVSIANVSDFLSELTGGELNISTGMINGLSREFALKTGAEQSKAFADLLLSPVMCTDFATVRVNGKNMNVAVCADPSSYTAMYFAREHKGHEGVKGTPVEDYQHTLVHDHDKTYYNYGGKHSECNQHPSRYLKGHMENEPDRKWAGQMRELIREMIHFVNGLDPEDGRNPDDIAPDIVKAYEDRYDEILALAKEEYEYEPPSEYYKDGFNLYKKLEKYKVEHLLFLHDRRVPATNNLSERLLRCIKRKLAQVMAFRSFDALDNLCRSLGTIAKLRAEGRNLYNSVASIYDRVVKQ
jgi:hypothetical protein